MDGWVGGWLSDFFLGFVVWGFEGFKIGWVSVSLGR